MKLRTLARAPLRRLMVLALLPFLPAPPGAVPEAAASVIATTDAIAIAAFQSGRTVLGFDELTVPPDGLCYIPFPVNQYAGLGILISAREDGTAQTHLAQMPDCGHFGSTLSPPNIIGGGTGPGTIWREAIRFDFPGTADAIGASSDWTGSNTTLTAYRGDGGVIASVSGNQGDFMGIAEPGIAYAVWKWNYDQGATGSSLDNVTFHVPETSVAAGAPTTSFAVAPNPVHSGTWVRWTKPVAGHVRVTVRDVAGKHVATIVDEQRPAGAGVARWQAADDRGARVPAGVYFVRFEAAGENITRRLVRIR